MIPSDKEELEDDPLTREFTPEKGDDEEEKHAPPSCIKLIYASRTHSQVNASDYFVILSLKVGAIFKRVGEDAIPSSCPNTWLSATTLCE